MAGMVDRIVVQAMAIGRSPRTPDASCLGRDGVSDAQR
jgi:hypothetical protein